MLVVHFFFFLITKLATRQDIILLSNSDVLGTALSTLQDRVVVGRFQLFRQQLEFNFAISLASAKVPICLIDSFVSRVGSGIGLPGFASSLCQLAEGQVM